MKKIISFFIVIALALTMCACVSGVSVPYYLLKIDNETPRVLQKYSGIKETLIYYKDGEEAFSYSTYIEYSENAEYGYNIFESFDGYTFYGYEGELYSVSDGKTYAVIQADNKNYYEYVSVYEPREHNLDIGEKFQNYSKKTDEGGTEVSYYAKMSVNDVAGLSEYGIKEGDKIISTYVLDKDDLYKSIVYSVEHADGKKEKIAERHFEYFVEKQNVFSSLPSLSDTVNIKLVYNAGTMNENSDVYKIPRGIYFGIDVGDTGISVYTDSSFTSEFDFENAIATEDVVLYIKKN